MNKVELVWFSVWKHISLTPHDSRQSPWEKWPKVLMKTTPVVPMLCFLRHYLFYQKRNIYSHWTMGLFAQMLGNVTKWWHEYTSAPCIYVHWLQRPHDAPVNSLKMEVGWIASVGSMRMDMWHFQKLVLHSKMLGRCLTTMLKKNPDKHTNKTRHIMLKSNKGL